MTQSQFNRLLGEAWKYIDKEMVYFSSSPHSDKKVKKVGSFRGFNPVILPDGTINVQRIILANYGLHSIHYTDVKLPKIQA